MPGWRSLGASWAHLSQTCNFGAVVAMLALAAPVRADVWGFVDIQGVAHFSAEQLDDRYALFFRNAESFDTSLDPPLPEPAASAPALPETPAPARLLAFFDGSPTFRQIRPHLLSASINHDVDFELLQALIATESGFDIAAVSPKGAIGLMQIMPDTARRYGVDSDRHSAIEKKLVDPRINIRTGTRYLRDLLNMFPGQLELALAAYNAGEGAVMRAGNQIPDFKETRNYVKNVMALYTALKPPTPPTTASPQRSYPNSRVRPTIIGGALNRGNKMPLKPSLPPKLGAISEIN